MGLDEAADRIRGNRRHVLAGRVAGQELEDEVDVIPLDRDAHVHELPVPRRCTRGVGKRVKGARCPTGEESRIREGREGETGRPADPFVEHDGGAASGVGQKLRAARVGRDERRFRRREGHVEDTARVESVHAQRSGQADRHLDRADEVLGRSRVGLAFGERAGIGERVARLPGQARERPALGHRVVCQRAAAGNVRRRCRVVSGTEKRCVILQRAIAERPAEVVGDAAVVGCHKRSVGLAHRSGNPLNPHEAPEALRYRQGEAGVLMEA